MQMAAKTQQATSAPLRQLALHSTTTCSTHATAYGKCILLTYTDVRKDSCKREFDKFGQCLREAVCDTSFSYREQFTDISVSQDETQMVIHILCQMGDTLWQ